MECACVRSVALTKSAHFSHRLGWRVRVLALARLPRRDVDVVARLNIVRDGECHRAPAVDDVVEDGVDEVKRCGVERDMVDRCFWPVLDLERVRPNAASPHRRRRDALDHVVKRDGIKD